jgi:hypothetical protein
VRETWCVLRPLRPLRGCTFSNVHIIRMESYVGFYDQFIVGGYVFVCGGRMVFTTDVFPCPLIVGKPHLVLVAVQGAPHSRVQ